MKRYMLTFTVFFMIMCFPCGIFGSYSARIWAIHGVSSPSLNVFTVTDDGVILHYNGTSWIQMPSTNANRLEDVFAISATDVYAVGSKGTLLHYDGTSWSKINSGTTKNLYCVWADSSNNVFIGGDHVLLHYDGTSWSVNTTDPTDLSVFDIWGTGPNNVYAVGQYCGFNDWDKKVLHYNGSAWSIEKIASGSCGYVYGMWGSSATDIYAVGYDTGGFIIHGNGSSWTTDKSGLGYAPAAVWGTAASDVYVFADYGYYYHYNGTSWSAIDTGINLTYTAAWGSSSSNIYAVGINTSLSSEIVHYDGQKWSKMSTPTPTTTTSSSTTTTTAASTTTTTSAPAGNTAPTAAFSVNPTVGDTSTSFILEPFASSDAEDPIAALTVRIDWETDGTWDDSIAADVDISHQYTADGTYTITIEVEDTGGLTDQTTQQVKVIAPVPGNTAPTASFTISPASGDTATTFSFDASASTDAEDPGNLEYLWDFEGDGIWDTPISNTPTTTWTYAAAGAYTVTLEILDTGGMTATATEPLTVSAASGGTTSTTVPAGGGNTAPTPVANVHPPEGPVDIEFEFNFEQSSDAEDAVENLEGRWDFDTDGTWDTEFSQEKFTAHRFGEPDLYTVTLEVKDTGGLTAQGTVEVLVTEAEGCALADLFGGDPDAIAALKAFRDDKLAGTRLGRAVIRAYYRNESSIGKVLDSSPVLRGVARTCLEMTADVVR